MVNLNEVRFWFVFILFVFALEGSCEERETASETHVLDSCYLIKFLSIHASKSSTAALCPLHQNQNRAKSKLNVAVSYQHLQS